MRAQLQTLDHLIQLMDPQLYLHLQSADSTNFFFFFRMLLVWYKREFEWVDVLRLWETLWTDYVTSNFHLFVAVAILEKHRDVIMDHLKQFDEVLKYSTFHSSHFHLIQLANIINPISQRTLQHHGPAPYPRPRRISLPPLLPLRRSNRQERQFPDPVNSTAQTHPISTPVPFQRKQGQVTRTLISLSFGHQHKHRAALIILEPKAR